jgi:hypothetical protein
MSTYMFDNATDIVANLSTSSINPFSVSGRDDPVSDSPLYVLVFIKCYFDILELYFD